jgi:hypothetical protein
VRNGILRPRQRVLAWVGFLVVAGYAPVVAWLSPDDTWLLPITVAGLIGYVLIVDDVLRRRPAAAPIEPAASPVEPVTTPIEPAASPIKPVGESDEPADAQTTTRDRRQHGNPGSVDAPGQLPDR